MTRRISILVDFVILVGIGLGCAPHRDAPPLLTPSAQAAVDEATRLEAILEKLYQEGKFQQVIPLAERIVALREQALGPRHPMVAESLNDLAMFYEKQGNYAKAEPLYLRVIDIQEKALGAMHPDAATSLNNLATLYLAQGAYTKAESLLLRALDIREKVLGARHPDVAVTLNYLARLHQQQGAYEKAEPLYLHALAILEKARGPRHPEVATCLNNVALLYQAQGGYAKAEPMLIRALDIYEKAKGPMHPNVAATLSNLAELYRAQGVYAKAEPLLIRSLDIWEKTLGQTHPEVAVGLNNLGILYVSQGAYVKAEPLYRRALEIRERALGGMHELVALSLHNLGHLYKEQGMYAKAEPLYIRALDIWEKTLGGAHPLVAGSLAALGQLYRAQGVYAKVEPLYIRALDIREKALGPIHPDVAHTLNSLAELYWIQSAYEKAVPLVARATEIHEAQLRLDLSRLPEPRKRVAMNLLQNETQAVLSLYSAIMPESQQALDLGFTTVLRRKGRALDSLADNQLNLRAHLTPVLRNQLDQLTAASSELSARLRTSRVTRTIGSSASAIAALRGRIDELESSLNTASAEFRVQSEPISIAKIQAALPPDSALVEFVRFHRYDPQVAQPHWQEERYIAYILTPLGPAVWVDLGEAAPIDAGVDAALAKMHKGTSTDAARAALQHLDTLVFAPLRDRLTNVSHVILSPDSKLNLVPFEALVDPQGHYEFEQRLVSYVTSGRDLLRLATRQAPRSSPTIVAAPDYGPPSSPARNGLGTFRPLDGATAEAADLPAYFVQAQTLTGDKATKAALVATVGPAVLHIATHGFYARDTAAPLASSDKSTGSAPSAASSAAVSKPLDSQRGIYLDGDAFSSAPPPPPSEDPTDALDRAGLALAGANVGPDGIVSARELASYDWWGTQLVVLSACETGVGSVPSGEGVYGMRRALVLAGAESQVVSLWNANDASTRELMRAFYGELARGTGRAEALRQAKLRLLRQPRFAHPYYWAAFIPAGDWTPLDPHLLKPQEHGR